ncbi:hypothetical protein NS23R_21040 [Enterobacter hormaechei]|nr:hypothetical protein NS23R_21040 [Enterobacter hormaechei]
MAFILPWSFLCYPLNDFSSTIILKNFSHSDEVFKRWAINHKRVKLFIFKSIPHGRRNNSQIIIIKKMMTNFGYNIGAFKSNIIV